MEETTEPPIRKLRFSPMVIGIIVLLVVLIVIIMFIAASELSKTAPQGNDLSIKEPPLEPYCGDGNCDSTESCSSCSEDCGACPTPEHYCGDGICSQDEHCSDCPSDCGECPEIEPGKPSTPLGQDCLDCISIVEIKEDALGEDRYNLNDEHVTFRNRCDYPCDLTGWTVENKQRCTYTFPDFILGSGERVRLYSGEGTDTDEYSIRRLYWRNDNTNCNEIWDNSVDNLYLKDAQENVAQVRSYW